MKTIQFLVLGGALVAALSPRGSAQTHFDTIYEFTGSLNGGTPRGLAAGPNGVLYGTAAYGGAYGFGTVFQLAPPSGPGESWTGTVLYSFAAGFEGSAGNPFGSPAVAANGVLYVTTLNGIFQLTPPSAPGGSWTGAPLNGEACIGSNGLVIGSGGVLYAVNSQGGAFLFGEVVQAVPPTAAGGTWTCSVLYNFTGDGRTPTGLTISPEGVLYGATTYGGSAGAGTLFELLPPAAAGGTWTEANIYTFTGGDDGDAPLQPPVKAADGNLYGTTSGGGTAGTGVVFKLTPSPGGIWTESVLYSFAGRGDGKMPDSPLLVQSGTIVGTTATGTGAQYGGGTVFELRNPGDGSPWTETILHGFPGPAGPYGSLVPGKSGQIYGITTGGPGPAGMGSVYRISR